MQVLTIATKFLNINNAQEYIVMSFETWKKKHYPIPASQVKGGRAAIVHSLNKWEGLQPEVLQEHGLTLKGNILEDNDEVLMIDCDSCALCVHYYDEVSDDKECDECPLFQFLGRKCDAILPDGPYVKFLDENNVHPMIDALRATLVMWDKAHSRKKKQK